MRHEFSKKTKALVLERAGWRCEATGERYGLRPGERCNADLRVTRAEHDHYPLPAHAEGSNHLDNDVVCCPAHNQYAANRTDKAREAKIKRVRQKHGLDPIRRKPKPKIKSRPMQSGKRAWPKRKFGG